MYLSSVNTRNTIARDGYLCPKIGDPKRDLVDPNLWESVSLGMRDSRVHLNGKVARRILPASEKDYCLWDDELIGFGLRIRPSGKRL